jgi:hypothetical protein
MAHTASDKKTLKSLAFTNSAISSSAVCYMFVKTAMNMLQYSICLRVLDTGQLMLDATYIA